MQLKNKLRWPFTRKGLNSSTVEPTLQENKDITSCSLYRSISDLPLSVFITCMVSDDLTALIISGTAQPQELLTAWADIKQQYADAVGDHEHRLATSLYRDLAILTCNYQLVLLLVDLLSKVYKKELADELNELLGTLFAFDISDPEKYQSELERCLKRSKAIEMDIELKERQYLSVSKSTKGESFKPTKEYFHSILITLSDHAKYAIQDNITVFEFCNRLKRYNHYVEEVQRLNRK
jgi:hypothetical protein